MAQLHGPQQSYAPSLLCSPNVLKLKLVRQEIWPQWCQGWQSAHCPTVCQACPAGWSLLLFYPRLGSHQTGTMGPPGSHVASWFPCGLEERFQQAHANPFRSPLSVPSRRGPDCWLGTTDRKYLNIPKRRISGFSQIGETLPLETLPETKIDLNSWNLMGKNLYVGPENEGTISARDLGSGKQAWSKCSVKLPKLSCKIVFCLFDCSFVCLMLSMVSGI